MRLLVFDGEETTAQQAAALIASTAREAIAARGRACLALSGGHTPWIMMRALGSAKRLPLVPAANRWAPMLAAWPTQ